MSSKKRVKITDSMQKVAVDILSDLEAYMMMSENYPEEVMQIYRKFYDKYELCDDPFVGLCCTTKEFFKQSHERDKQLMYERYGHCDGLD